MGIIDTIADTLFPPYCINCGKVENWLCEKCNLKLQPTLTTCYVCNKVSKGFRVHKQCGSPFENMFVGWNYTKVSRKIMSVFKYQGAYRVIQNIVPLLFQRLKAFEGLKDTILIPVPLHPSRERSRGFNQSKLIANVISKEFGIPVRPDIVRRIKNTKHQAYINREGRINNIKDSFYVSKLNDDIKKAVIIDDVLTTGSTINEVGRVINDRCPNIKISGIVLFRSLFREK
jgi:competence protein ComFC